MARQKKYWIHKKISNIEHEVGFAYRAKINPGLSSHRGPSPALLLEDNVILGPASPLTDIRVRGEGTYSFWHSTLYFSSSDNSNPCENGRIYEIAYPATVWGVNLLEFIGIEITRPAVPVNFYPRDIQNIDADVQYAISVGKNYIEWLPEGQKDIRGKVVLEIGPGKNFGSALYLTCFGARALVADAFLAPWDKEYHPRLYTLMRDAILQESPQHDITPFNRILSFHGYDPDIVKPVRTSLEDLEGIPSSSVDYIFSNAALEHIYDPRRAFKSLARVTKPGGAGFHQIDFRDHRNFDAPLEFLLLKDTEIAKLGKEANQELGNLWRPYDYELGNRWRPAEYRRLFQKNQFRVIKYSSTLDINREYLREILPRLREVSGSRYQKYPEEDLQSVSGYFIVERL